MCVPVFGGTCVYVQLYAYMCVLVSMSECTDICVSVLCVCECRCLCMYSISVCMCVRACVLRRAILPAGPTMSLSFHLGDSDKSLS